MQKENKGIKKPLKAEKAFTIQDAINNYEQEVEGMKQYEKETQRRMDERGRGIQRSLQLARQERGGNE